MSGLENGRIVLLAPNKKVNRVYLPDIKDGMYGNLDWQYS
jgi:hypothetical protein